MDINAIFNGISLGEITLGGILQAVLTALIGAVIIRIIMNIVEKMLEKSPVLTDLKVYVRSVVRVLLWFLVILMVAPQVGVDVTSLIAMLSVAGLAVSLALQNTLSNLAGGIMVLLAKPFAVGDFIESDGMSGTVAGVDLAYTSIITIDNKEIFIPNSHISAAKITNYTRMGKRRVDLFFTASYDAPTATVKTAIQEVLDAIPQVLRDEKHQARIYLTDYQASSIQYTVRAWTNTEHYWDVYFAIQEGVRESFDRHGVEMTYDHLNVHLVEK